MGAVTNGFGGDHHFIAPREILEGATQEFFGSAVGIGIGGVEEIDSRVHRLADYDAAWLLGKRPGMIAALGNAKAHAAQAYFRDLQAGIS